MSRGATYLEVSYSSPAWFKLRAQQLRKEPWCRYCQLNGFKTEATHADHRQPHRGDPELFFDPDNLQSLCAVCANSVKQREEIAGGEIGCDLSGVPRDATHPWNGGSVVKSTSTSQGIGRLLAVKKRASARGRRRR